MVCIIQTICMHFRLCTKMIRLPFPENVHFFRSSLWTSCLLLGEGRGPRTAHAQCSLEQEVSSSQSPSPPTHPELWVSALCSIDCSGNSVGSSGSTCMELTRWLPQYPFASHCAFPCWGQMVSVVLTSHGGSSLLVLLSSTLLRTLVPLPAANPFLAARPLQELSNFDLVSSTGFWSQLVQFPPLLIPAVLFISDKDFTI